MLPVALFSLLTLLAIGWMLYINAKDRKQLEQELLDDADDKAARR
ncbi:hypothetical protein QPK31_16155 [Massilia sp. YIM B02769]|nr:hypothetical protein [Massilia sp. YIM B02769]MDN4059759.1 hypothetical protein [Massilia sp. YIM B02769]